MLNLETSVDLWTDIVIQSESTEIIMIYVMDLQASMCCKGNISRNNGECSWPFHGWCNGIVNRIVQIIDSKRRDSYPREVTFPSGFAIFYLIFLFLFFFPKEKSSCFMSRKQKSDFH